MKTTPYRRIFIKATLKLLARSFFTGFRYDGMNKFQTIKSDINFVRIACTL